MLGAGTAAFAAPLAVAYALQAARRAPDRLLGRAALGLALLEGLVCLVLALGWLWQRAG